MEYIILSRHEGETLAEDVNKFIAQGWELYGHPFASRKHDRYGGGIYIRVIHQAMIKRVTNE